MAVMLSVYVKDQYYQIPIEGNSRVTIGSSKRDTLTLQENGLTENHFIFTSKNDAILLNTKTGVYQNGVEIRDTSVSVGDVFSINGISVYVCPKQRDCEQTVALSLEAEILVGRSRECSLCLSNKRVSSRHAKIQYESGKYKVVDLDSKNHTFVNGKRIAAHYLHDGDIISIAYYSIVYDNSQLVFLNTGDDLDINLDKSSIARKYPLFRRSPRLEQTYEKKIIEIQPPPIAHGKPEINWLSVLLPPAVMIGVSIASILLLEGSLTNLLFIVPMSLVSVITAIISYLAQLKKHATERKRKESHYKEYIDGVFSELKEGYLQQFSIVNNTNPSTEYCRDIVTNRMRRLWERSVSDQDFLSVRVGHGTLPLNIDVVFPQIPAGEEESAQLKLLRENITSLCSVKDIAITLPVKSARSIGVVGNRQVAVHMMQNTLIQLTTHHSYVDINLIVIAGERDYEQWAWTRWLPHSWTMDRKVCCVSSKKDQAMELLNEWEDILKKRIDVLNSTGPNNQCLLPYLIFVITDHALVENRELVKLISSAEQGLGVCAFLLFDSLSKLPKDCDWFVELNSSGGNMYSRTMSGDRTSFTLDSFDGYEQFARSMAPIRDRLAERNGQLPAGVTFFQGYGVKEAEEITVSAYWSASQPHRSLAAPIGIRENGKPFLFDIHERAHGPHGLVAGTTGSGKSEVLQTWILSMCANYLPQDVSFVLIDFKGMGLAGALKGLPHIAGTISDVDENIQRNLFSLESELSRRKVLFAEVSSDTMKIGDIYDYQEAYKQGRVSEPLSHLIIVVDEFAELKLKFPEFMTALDSAARVGRSLGVHLVLATQKPDGVVTDEVRANSKFKWCLRVANEGESKAVISRPEAAHILSSAPGRAYIQIGNNEIFEQIQTFYSGAPVRNYIEDSQKVSVAFVDAIGHREYIGSKAQENDAQKEKELLALVKWISRAHASSGLPPARKVWENSLPKRLVLSQIPVSEEKSLLSAVIGIVDDPRHQRQFPCEIDFAGDGHILIYGAPGTGKTFLLQTIVMSLASRYTPDEVNIYVMDFGSWSMKNLQSLPHMGGVANGNEEEKLLNLTKMLNGMLDRRKTMFAQIGASSLSSYRRASKEQTPAIVVIVDNFAPIREMYPDIETAFVRLSREGSSYGIFLAITSTSLSGSIGYNLTQNFKQALSLRMTEKADYRDIVGDTEGLEPAKNPGRGLIGGKPPMEFQTALAVGAADDIEYVSMLKKRCSSIADQWHGALPAEIPVMPDIVLIQHLGNIALDRIAIGLSEESIVPVMIPFDNHLTIISGTEKSGKTNMLRVIERQLHGKQGMTYVDGGDAEKKEAISAALRRAADGETITLLFDNLTQWLSTASYEDTSLIETLVNNVKTNHFALYAAADAVELVQTGGSLAGRMIQIGWSILLGGSFNEHSSQFEATNLSYSAQGEQLGPCYGYLIHKKRAVKFKAMLAGRSNENGL